MSTEVNAHVTLETRRWLERNQESIRRNYERSEKRIRELIMADRLPVLAKYQQILEELKVRYSRRAGD